MESLVNAIRMIKVLQEDIAPDVACNGYYCPMMHMTKMVAYFYGNIFLTFDGSLFSVGGLRQRWKVGSSDQNLQAVWGLLNQQDLSKVKDYKRSPLVHNSLRYWKDFNVNYFEGHGQCSLSLGATGAWEFRNHFSEKHYTHYNLGLVSEFMSHNGTTDEWQGWQGSNKDYTIFFQGFDRKVSIVGSKDYTLEFRGDADIKINDEHYAPDVQRALDFISL